MLLLAACTPPPPVFKPVTVDVPVAVPCPTPHIQPPMSALQQLPIGASLFDETKAALIELDARKAYEAQIEAALNACHP